MNAFGKVIFTACVVAGAKSARAALISDFSTPASTSAFTRYTVLDQDANKDNTISAPSGALFATKGTAATPTNAEQSVFSQNLTLSVGDTLRVDYIYGAASPAMYADLGIFVGAQPTDLTYTTGTVSTRANYVIVYANNQSGDVKALDADGTTVPSATVSKGAASKITGLYITRTSANGFTVGDVIGGVDTVVKTYTITSGVPFTQIGVYTDLRNTGTSAASLDNLQVAQSIPEPNAVASLGALSLTCLRRRRA